jgi:hypothetical protein
VTSSFDRVRRGIISPDALAVDLRHPSRRRSPIEALQTFTNMPTGGMGPSRFLIVISFTSSSAGGSSFAAEEAHYDSWFFCIN